MKTSIVIGLLVMCLSLVACGQSLEETTTQKEKPTGNEHVVIIDDSSFTPEEIQIDIGDTVTWINQGTGSHTVTSWYKQEDEDHAVHVFIGETWDSGYIEPGESYSKTFNAVGFYDYFSFPLLESPTSGGIVPFLEPAIEGGKVRVTYGD